MLPHKALSIDAFAQPRLIHDMRGAYAFAVVLPRLNMVQLMVQTSLVLLSTCESEGVLAAQLTSVYQELIDALVAVGYEVRKDLFGAPYDWRLAADGLEQARCLTAAHARRDEITQPCSICSGLLWLSMA